nr:efflux RND transporter permease subunit [Odoribacter sp.]
MKLSAFSINTLFIVLMLLGIALIPKTPLQLMPSSRSNELSISFSWTDANPEMLEMEVTSVLEGVFARTKGLTDIRSYTGQGYGNITLLIDKNENIDAIKLYLSSLVRSLSKGLPEGVQIGTIQGGGIQREKQNREDKPLLLNYTITGTGSSQEVATFAEEHIVPVISQIPGISQVTVTGATPFEWVLFYNEQTLQDIQISPSDIAGAIRRYYSQYDGGKVLAEAVPAEKYAYLVFKGNPDGEEVDFLNIPIKSINGKIIHVRDVVTLDYCERQASSY